MLLYLVIFFIFCFIIIVILFVEMCIHFDRKKALAFNRLSLFHKIPTVVNDINNHSYFSKATKQTQIHDITLLRAFLQGCVHYIFASLFLSLKESTCETRKNVFYSNLKAFFVLKKIKFKNFRYSSFVTSSNA